jgi:ubiquinone/menaquinone biosynthesis C-methylase UbiE
MDDERAIATEFIDQPDCDATLAAISYRFMERINRYFGGIRVVRDFLSEQTANGLTGGRIRILDIGTGSCDIPLAINRWAHACGLDLHFTCLETAHHAIAIATEKLGRAGDPRVQLLQADVFAHRPMAAYDYAVASMCFHHFSDSQIIAVLQRLRRFVRRGVLINDLRRSRAALLAVRPLLISMPLAVRHDALLSIRRGFKVDELKHLLHRLNNVTVGVRAAHWFRIAATVRFDPGGRYDS